MTAPILQGTGTVDAAIKLLLRGTQTDPFGEVLGGHKSLYDYSTLGDSITSGQAIENLIFGGEDGVAEGMPFLDIQTHKGLRKANTAATGVKLGSGFDLLSYGSEPSVVISAWMTHEDISVNASGIFGYAHQNGSYLQYQWSATNSGGNIKCTIGAGVGVAYSVTETVAEDTPILHTIYCEKTAAGVYRARVFLDAVLIGTAGGRAYPFADPTGSEFAAVAPRFGWAGGFSSNYQGVLHRAQALQVDPASFDIDTWLANEIALNAPRWA